MSSSFVPAKRLPAQMESPDLVVQLRQRMKHRRRRKNNDSTAENLVDLVQLPNVDHFDVEHDEQETHDQFANDLSDSKADWDQLESESESSEETEFAFDCADPDECESGIRGEDTDTALQHILELLQNTMADEDVADRNQQLHVSSSWTVQTFAEHMCRIQGKHH